MARKPAPKSKAKGKKAVRGVRGYAEGGSVPDDGTRMLMAGIEAGSRAAAAEGAKTGGPVPNPARGYGKGGLVPRDGKKRK